MRGHCAGDAAARERADTVLGDRAARRFLLSDAQYVIAREHAHPSWAAFRRTVEASPLGALAAVERGEVVVDSGLTYGDRERVMVLVRKRLHRYLVTDGGRALARAGKLPGWLEVAEIACLPMNVDGQGMVFVPVVEGRDIADVVVRLADASRAVHEALLVLDGS